MIPATADAGIRAGEIVDEIVDALQTAGLRVADTFGDVVPPGFYVGLEGATSDGGTLAYPAVGLLQLWWIPVRGLGNTRADLSALLAAIDALGLVALEPLEFRSATLTVDPTAPWVAWRTYLVPV
jgi:hypothetical protein